MRQLIVISHLTLDGVIQSMGTPQEDASGGFAHGGWVAPYADAVLSAVIRHEMAMPVDVLLGRRTFDIWAAHWPHHPDAWPNIQTATKYVVSNTLSAHPWQPSVFLGGDVVSAITALKQQSAPDLHVYGSSQLVQTLMAHHLVDALWLKIYPLVLGEGKRLFSGGHTPSGFRLTDSQATPSGVLLARYER
jgi:dihydrofolate reductase